MSLIDTIAVPFAKTFFGMTGRVRIYEQLQALLEGDLKLDRALDAIWDRASKQGRSPTSVDAIVVDAWRQEYRKAASLAEAVKGWVPIRDQMLIEAGELSGDLVGTLIELQQVNQSVARMKGELVGALVYPLILMAAIVGIIYIFGASVIPEFAAIMPVEEWTGIAATMADLAAFTQTALVPTLLGIAAFFTLLSLSMSRWRGFLRTRFDKLPPWSLYRLFQGVAFMLSLSALLRAGVHLPVALARLRDNANPWMRERIAGTLYHVNTGASLGDALDRTGHDFPDADLVSDLRIFSQISGVEVALSRLAKRWVDEGVKRVGNVAKTVRAFMMFGFTGVIAWLYYGLFDLYQMIQAAASF